VSNASGYSASKHVPLWELLWFSVVANTSITGMNLSLMLNSVGFYQVLIQILDLTFSLFWLQVVTVLSFCVIKELHFWVFWCFVRSDLICTVK
jgi:hypothetical protein